jgi:hypothetical protein
MSQTNAFDWSMLIPLLLGFIWFRRQGNPGKSLEDDGRQNNLEKCNVAFIETRGRPTGNIWMPSDETNRLVHLLRPEIH